MQVFSSWTEYRVTSRYRIKFTAPTPDGAVCYPLKKSAFFFMKCRHLAGTSASTKIADTGQAGSHAAQSMQVIGSMYICGALGPPSMQSTGHTSTQANSFAPTHGSQIT